MGVCSSMRTSYMVADRESGLKPRPCVRLACGSKSIKTTLLPRWDSPTPTLIVVVVLPTPPFWFATAITRGMTGSIMPACK